MSALDTFLNSLVESVSQVMQISDASLGGFPADDPIVRKLAHISYSQACNYCSRRFLLNTYTEEYHSVTNGLALRQTPVTSVTSVWVDDVELVLDVDYTVSRNRIKLILEPATSLADTYLPSNKDVVVEYIGGYELITDCPDILNALTLQTISLYNRRSNLGIATTTGRTSQGITGSSTVGGPTDKGELLDSVKIILDSFISFADVDYVV
jgi:hypothetical protein